MTDCTTRLDDLPILFEPLALATLSDDKRIRIAQIDALLPQTQCGLCSHHDGCLPYAHGIVIQGEAPNLCVPGGQAVSDGIASILDVEPQPATPSKWQIDPISHRPIEVRAIIREDDCIGCTKCIPACPVDAIIGTAKHMHSIITELCTGCELCLAPCPVDCIDLVEHPRHIDDSTRQKEQAHLRQRYHKHLNRVAKTIEDGTKPVVSTIESQMVNVMNTAPSQAINAQNAKNTIAAAKLRTQIKKLGKQLAVRADDELQARVDALSRELAMLESNSQT
ncbi:RnfABCDGE type electron transport complex subunit B [Moraxella pluranimalium]|uniref:Iron-sulfur protein n=1 Tax=Moraxella pluranimalium TaxID=470453 RepID=A0A1T0CRZ4_9GAMM|nr:RnfABCDGE type electron transport complex subunit B [Moraxella pluranimalium]OOS25087.1 iron-sulfur protein [Moraxella pluranimalium]